MKKELFSFCAAFLCGTLLFGADAPAPQGAANRADGLYEVGAPIHFSFSGLPKDTELPVSLRGDKTVLKNFKAKSDAQGNLKVETKLGRPGFVRCAVTYGKNKTVMAGAASHPEKLKGARPMPADFTSFWNEQTALLEKTPLKPELKRMPESKGFEVYDLTLPCPGSQTPVRGYFVTKKDAKAKTLPAILTLHGAGVSSASQGPYWAQKGFMSLDINAHGIDNGKPRNFYQELGKTGLKTYWMRGFTNRKENYFHGMILRVYRALQFLKSRPEWDGKTLIAYGSSQGGLQALAAGGLDSQVTAVVAFVAAGCDHAGHLAGRDEGWPHYRYHADYKKNPKKAADEIDYLDCVNFARQIKKADLFMSVGLIDTTCPAASSCSAFNEAPTTGKKELVIGPKAKHQSFKEATDGAIRFVTNHKNRK